MATPAGTDDWATLVEQNMTRQNSNQALINSNSSTGPTSPVPKGILKNSPTKVTFNSQVHTSDDPKEVDTFDPAKESLLNKLLTDKLKFLNHTVSLEVQQKNPNSPLYSAKSFEELNLSNELKRALRDMNYERPSKIQEIALPLLLTETRDNMIAQSQSGTGKTAAFVLTVLSRIDPHQAHPQALILAPTYELALQIGLTVESMGKYLMANGSPLIAYATKGNDPAKGQKIEQPIIIGTPGTVLKWVQRCKAFDPKKVHVVVFDEADVMISDRGHKDETVKIKRMLTNKNLQALLFSATYEEAVLNFANAIIKDANKITLRREEESLDCIQQFFVKTSSNDDKMTALKNIYGIIGGGQAIVFCKRRDTAQYVGSKLQVLGHQCSILSSNLDTMERADVIRRFREGLEKVLISTNVVARGIDVEQVTFVVNYDLPDRMEEGKGLVADCETYLHRIGRTGRFGKTGIAVNFISNDKDAVILKDIESHFGKKIEELNVHDIDDMEEKLM